VQPCQRREWQCQVWLLQQNRLLGMHCEVVCAVRTTTARDVRRLLGSRGQRMQVLQSALLRDASRRVLPHQALVRRLIRATLLDPADALYSSQHLQKFADLEPRPQQTLTTAEAHTGECTGAWVYSQVVATLDPLKATVCDRRSGVKADHRKSRHRCPGDRRSAPRRSRTGPPPSARWRAGRGHAAVDISATG
jgi:hypothetical protein